MSDERENLPSENDLIFFPLGKRKSDFGMLTLEERVHKMRDYLKNNTYPFYNMSKEHKRNFRRLFQIHRIDPDDQYTIQRKVKLSRKEGILSDIMEMIC